MAKYQAYAEYKDSGVEWLGRVPSHWIITTLKRYCYVKGGFAFSSDAFIDTGFPVIRIGDIKTDGSINLENCKYIPESLAVNSRDYLVEKNQLLMAMTGATIGKAGLYTSNQPAFLNQRVGKFELLAQNMNYRYLWYILKTGGYQEYIKLTAFGGAQPNISDTAMVDYPATIPSFDEQTKIANFLDHETTKIDHLIEKQQQLIELLKEKRQAVISHAVTKGLNPDVTMKDSGVAWLGEVPAHWEVSRVGWLCEFISYGFTNPMPSTDEGPYMLTATDIEFGRVKYEGARRTSIEAFRNLLSPKSKPQAGDILVTKDGTLGRTALFDGDNEVCISQSVALLRLQKKIVLPEFLVRAFSGADYQSKIIFDAGGTTIKHIYISTLSKMNFVLPPIHEQKTIVDELKSKLADMDRLINQAINASNLLGERRTALISSAVTGKIDVRNWQSPTVAEADTELSA